LWSALSVVDEVVAELGVEHQDGMQGGREPLKVLIRELREAFPDLHYEVVRTSAGCQYGASGDPAAPRALVAALLMLAALPISRCAINAARR
jgi:MYXO-CTERM domain-containing protein